MIPFPGLWLAALALVHTPAAVAVSHGTCSVGATTLDEARHLHTERCPKAPRDCDQGADGWHCSSALIGESAPHSAPLPSAVDECTATAATLSAARAVYAASCVAPRRDCDSIGDLWLCSSETIGERAPRQDALSLQGSPGRSSTASNPTPIGSPPRSDASSDADPDADAGGLSASPSPSMSAPPNPSPAIGPELIPSAAPSPSSDGRAASPGALRVEAESGELGYGWQDEGGHILWNAPSDRYTLSRRGDDANIVYTLNVPAAGRYRFTMRSAALGGPNPQEPANDVWVTFGDVPWTKAYMPRDRRWHVAAVGEREGRHTPALLESDLPAGPVTVTVSGRSTGHAIDWIGLVRVGDVPAGPSGGADLLVLHYDSSYDPDDLQAMVAAREILDAVSAPDLLVVNGTRKHSHEGVLAGSLELARSLFPDTIDALGDPEAETKVASAWQLTLDAGGRVLVAEGGPSDFTARVLRILRDREVPNLERVRVVQHSHGWNEDNTRPDNLALVRALTTYVRIDDGNRANATPAFLEPRNAAGRAFRQRALASEHGAAWRTAFAAIDQGNVPGGNRRSVDFSDTVELMHLLGLPKSNAPTVGAFADRYL